MPDPVSRYHFPLSGAGSTPACRQSSSSFLWVPESSPREAKTTRFLAIFASARRGCHAGDCRRIVRRPDDNKIVVHDVEAFGAIPGVDEILLILFGMDARHRRRRCGRFGWPGLSRRRPRVRGFSIPLEFRQDAAIEPEFAVEVVDCRMIERSCVQASKLKPITKSAA